MKNIMEMPIIRLNGSSYINDMELKERYKVYNDSCWISLLSLVGNPDGAIVTVDEPVSPLLTMDLEKRLKTALEEDPADFLVVDMCYTAGHRLCVWKDQVFTKNPKFEESRFYAEHQDEMEEIDVMRDRNFDWKPYMDRYLELISKYFDKDHIILIKSRCPKWFATHTHVRKVQKKSSKAYNRRIKELEDYFVEKTDPYVIDIYSHYFLDFNHKKGYTMSSYEKPFYHHARRLVSYIIRYQPEKRVFTEDEFYIRFGRFIKYYDNLFAKNNTALFMDDSKFIDHLILSLGRPVLVEFEYDIVKIQQEGYASIQEILDKYDFRFSEGLCTCLKVVQAVEEGDLFRKGVQYEAIYEYKMKIVKAYTELVKKELEKRGWLEGTMYINEVHAGTFDAILRALDAGKGKEAKKILFAAAEEDFEHDRIKECYHKELEVDKQLAPIRALNAFYEPVQVDLWGSCITREILNEDTGRFKIGKYAYRNSFLFAFDEPIPYDDTKFENLSLFENSNWRVGYIKSAFHKDLPGQLEATGSKWLLLDFYDLICDVVKYRGGYLTADSEVRGLGFYKEIKDDCELTTVEDVLSDEEIKARFDTFIEFLKRRYGKQIIFIKADVKLKFLDYQRRKKAIRGYKQATLKKKKAFLQKWQDYFEEQMDCHVIDYAKDYDADDLCVSGAFMVHYEKEFYEKGYQALLDIIYRG